MGTPALDGDCRKTRCGLGKDWKRSGRGGRALSQPFREKKASPCKSPNSINRACVKGAPANDAQRCGPGVGFGIWGGYSKTGRRHDEPISRRFQGELSTDFSCFDSALRSIYGRCGQFADLLGKSGRAAHEAFFPKCFHRFGRDFLKFCDFQKSARVAGPGRAAPEFALPHPVAKAVKLSTDFSCFDSTLRSIHGRCGRSAEFMGKKKGAWAPFFELGEKGAGLRFASPCPVGYLAAWPAGAPRTTVTMRSGASTRAKAARTSAAVTFSTCAGQVFR